VHKAELIDAVTQVTSLPRAQVEAVCNALLEQIMDHAASGEKITVPGFGTFQARDRAAREGRNPATGEPLHISATRIVGFTAGSVFKQRVAPPRPHTTAAPVTAHPKAMKAAKKAAPATQN
jgi:DNA-binding protein HU-beta